MTLKRVLEPVENMVAQAQESSLPVNLSHFNLMTGNCCPSISKVANFQWWAYDHFMLIAMIDGTTSPGRDDTHAVRLDYAVDTIVRIKGNPATARPPQVDPSCGGRSPFRAQETFPKRPSDQLSGRSSSDLMHATRTSQTCNSLHNDTSRKMTFAMLRTLVGMKPLRIHQVVQLRSRFPGHRCILPA
ncbi:uncharacterized protein N7473_002006 [Penicillium subrubescens]|uniref:uncharacterized protein n=1 Tax=Penicillium subrubescens TaxID=1316194 RepID=UPI002545B96C|nr:uncharacterized protein N7473_002006 [Penicillium subrubescens]KAJ5905090.1 hypothetical protein N7473_002006 [Penicillium subrubescens]